MGMGIHKQMNGAISNGVLAHESSFTPITTALHRLGPVRQFVDILRSAVPLLSFLSIYGINQNVHILPRFEDANCINLYNVSAFEYSLLRCQPHKVISSWHNTFLDVLSAMPYLLHYVLPVCYPMFLFFTGRIELVSRFYLLLGSSMWTMFVIWKFMPTAPPWMYDNMEEYARSNTTPPPIQLMHREGCAFSRLDKLTGINFFFNMFGGNPVPFASFPSGHVAWPTCIYIVTPPGGRLFGIYVLWVTWATLYSCHHYLSDAVAALIIVVFINKVIIYVNDKVRQRVKPLCTLPTSFCSFNIV